LVNFVITGACLSSKEDKVVLYAVRRDSSYVEGFVMSGEDLRSVRKESVYGVKPVESVKSWRRQWGWVNRESVEDRVVI